MSRRQVVLFDLDGTLSDSAPGILTSLRHAFAVNGVAPLDADTERTLLGPPFYTSLPPHIGGEAALPGVLAAYREHYSGGSMYDTVAYPGVADVLRTLRADGRTLAVATSKPEINAVPIVAHLGLAEFFDTVGGDELDGSFGTKALVIGRVLERLGHPDPSTVVMIGDREHDILGARAHDIDGVGVRWGYGRPGELESCGPVAICGTAAELTELLLADG